MPVNTVQEVLEREKGVIAVGTVPRVCSSMRSLSILMMMVALAATVAAQDDPHAACARTGWVPREILERPVPRRSGTGGAHEAVTTSSPEAQAFYDQGLDYLHGYVWIEAARSFRQALRIDPRLAMAYVGLSRVYSGLDDAAAAGDAQQRAESLTDGLSDRERRRVALRSKHLEALASLGDAGKHAEYKKAIDEALAQDIADPELWLQRGNAEEATAAGRGQRGGAASTAFYLAVLRLDPNNAAAHHYLTHSYETIGQIPPALEHGEAYARLAPAIPHAHHMWGHDLRRVGRIDDAIAAFRRTDELERAYYSAERIPANLDWHHIHNLDLLATAYQYKGQMRLAEQAMREAAALVPVTDYLEYNRKALATFLLARQRYGEALDAARELTNGQWAATRTVGQAIAGQALLGLGKIDEAREALAAAEKELHQTPVLAGGITVARSAAEPQVEMLRGQILLRSGQTVDGRARLQDVERRLRAIPGPDAWIQALFHLEAIARAARDVYDWELAEHTARQMMEHDPNYAGSHLAMAAVAAHKGDGSVAARSLEAAERAWRDADPDLPELRQIRARRAAR
jgi:tetratricopeptide (TPR) repeat protein